jgi:hypothetical protein
MNNISVNIIIIIIVIVIIINYDNITTYTTTTTNTNTVAADTNTPLPSHPTTTSSTITYTNEIDYNVKQNNDVTLQDINNINTNNNTNINDNNTLVELHTLQNIHNDNESIIEADDDEYKTNHQLKNHHPNVRKVEYLKYNNNTSIDDVKYNYDKSNKIYMVPYPGLKKYNGFLNFVTFG